MNICFIDIIILIFLCWFGYRGFKNGLIFELAIPGGIDHFFGLLFGVLKVATVASVILYTIQNIDTHEIILKKEIKENSLAFRYIEPIVPDAMKWHEDHAMESPAPETILPQ